MYFGVLLFKDLKNTKNTFFFIVILFLHIECYSFVSAFWYLRSSKTLKIHVSRIVLYFPDVVYFQYICVETENVETENARFC